MGRLSFVYKNLLLFFAVFVVGYSVAHAQKDSLLSRYKQYLFRSGLPAGIEKLYLSYDTVSQWPDIDYNDTQPANWQPLKHLQRIRDISLAWTSPASSHYHDKSYWKVISAGLEYWLHKRPHNNNWWHNQIGVPQYMRDIIVLLRDSLAKEQFDQSLQVLNQYRLQQNGEGANLVWSADLGLHYAALTGNDTLMKRCVELLVNELKITTGDGVQPDWSFRQHGARLQMYQYGRAFLWENIRIAWQLRSTSSSYPAEKIELLVNGILKGWQWMARGINTVPGTIDRSVSRVGALQSADLRPMIPYLRELYPAGINEFLKMERSQDGKEQHPLGFWYFPYVDFAAYHTKTFSFFVKTISDRTLTTESINNENLKGKLLNSGDAYVIRSGKEYFDLMPCWDWELLPGITTFKGADHIQRRPFTGSVTDEKSGFTVMDYCLQNKNSQGITAKKMWACHNGIVVCLVAGLEQKDMQDDIVTVLNQCRWHGNVFADTQKDSLTEGEHMIDKVKWLYHDGLAYLFLQPTTIDIKLKTVTGTWAAINASGPKETVTEKVFLPVIKHRLEKSSHSIGYVLTSCETSAGARLLSQSPSWAILRNDTSCQAILFADGTIMAAFFSAGSLTIQKKKLVADKPCLVMIKKNHLSVSNPSQFGTQINISFNSRAYTILLNGHGFSTGILLK